MPYFFPKLLILDQFSHKEGSFVKVGFGPG
jgi:hypothetical protein